MTRSLCLTLILAAGAIVQIAPAVRAQDAATPRSAGARSVFGEVIHDETAAPVQGATVVLSAHDGVVRGSASVSAFMEQSRSVHTDDAGRYRFDGVATGSYVLRVHRLGFRPASVEIAVRGGDSRVSVGLAVVPVRLQPMSVVREAAEPFGRRTQPIRPESIDTEGMTRAAALRQRQRLYLGTDVREVTHSDVVEGVTLAESDLFRALQRLPGVSTRNEYSAELWTRGAGWGRTRVLFDGLPLFNPLHGPGTFSAVNEDAIGAAFMHPGVRPAAIGEGGAGVLDLRSRAGGGDGALRGVGELSLVSARAALDQRIANDRGAWMIAGRRTYLDLLLPRVAGNRPESNFPFHFGELTGRLDWELGDGHALEVSALHERDRLTGDIVDVAQGNRAHWGNDLARVTLESPVNVGPLGPTIARHTMGVSRYDAQVTRRDPGPANGEYEESADAPVNARLSYVAFSGELTPAVANGALTPWALGYELVHQRADVGGMARSVYVGDVLDSSHTSRRAALTNAVLWGERRWQPHSRLTVAPGLRLETGSALRGTGSVRIAPRLTARYAPSDSALLLSAAIGRSYQYSQSLPGIGSLDAAVPGVVPLWLMASGDTPPLRTDLFTVGAERWLNERWHASLNGYARQSGGLLVADPRPGPITSHELYAEGTESAHGAEAAVRRIQGRWTFGFGYAYGEARVEAAGQRFASPEDRRHSFDVTSMARVGGGVRLGAAYTSSTGIPFTRRSYGAQSTSADGSGVIWNPPPMAEAPSGARLPRYSTLDVMLDWSGAVRDARLGLFVQLHNALGQKNYTAYRGPSYCTGSDAQAGFCRRGDELSEGLPPIPVVGLRLAF